MDFVNVTKKKEGNPEHPELNKSHFGFDYTLVWRYSYRCPDLDFPNVLPKLTLYFKNGLGQVTYEGDEARDAWIEFEQHLYRDDDDWGDDDDWDDTSELEPT